MKALKHLAKAPGHFHQQLVTHDMPEAVIDVLEVVDVDDHQRMAGRGRLVAPDEEIIGNQFAEIGPVG